LVSVSVVDLQWAWLVQGWVNHPQVGKPPWYITNHSGQLSHSLVLLKAGE